MNELSINIPISAFNGFDPAVRSAITAYVTSQLGGQVHAPLIAPIADARNDKGLAKLEVSEAKLFLNNCSEKSTTILREIVKHDGDLLASTIHKLFGTKPGELRGAWSGLTKRVRTVTKDPEAVLLGWFKQGDDWRLIMATQTVASMRIALSERG